MIIAFVLHVKLKVIHPNAELRPNSNFSNVNRMSAFQRNASSSKSKLMSGKSFQHVDRNEQLWISRHNSIQNKVQDRQQYLLLLQDKMNEFTVSLNSVSDEDKSNKQIKILENKVDNLIIKLNEAINIKKQFEERVLVFKKQRVMYDKQLILFDQKVVDKQAEFKKVNERFYKEQRETQELQNKIRENEVKREEAIRTRESYLQDIMKKNEYVPEVEKTKDNKVVVNFEESKYSPKNVSNDLISPRDLFDGKDFEELENSFKIPNLYSKFCRV